MVIHCLAKLLNLRCELVTANVQPLACLLHDLLEVFLGRQVNADSVLRGVLDLVATLVDDVTVVGRPAAVPSKDLVDLLIDIQ